MTIEPSIAVIVGALAGVVVVRYAEHAARSRLVYGAALLVAAAVYVAFALATPAPAALSVELAGVAVFAVFAGAGMRGSRQWLAAGWLAHIAWDLILHETSGGGYVPAWYPAACVGFDGVVAGALALPRSSRDGSVREGP